MNGTWAPFAGWLLHSAVGGGLLLLLAWKLMNVCPQPAWRERLGEWAVLSALLLGALTLGPCWIKLSLLEPVRRSAGASEPAPFFNVPGPIAAPREPAVEAAMLSARDDSRPGFETEREQEDAVGQDNALAALSSGLTADFASVQADTAQELADPKLDLEEFGVASPSAPGFLELSDCLTWLGVTYAAGAAFFFGRWLLGNFVLWRLVQSARPAPEALNGLFQTMACGWRRRPRLLVARQLRVPLSCGLLRPTVIVPLSLCEAHSRRTLRWVFVHELTHLERGDPWTCLLFGVGQALYFYLPWFWWLRRQVRLCQEYIADAAAADQSAAPEDYAQFLLTLTRAPSVPLGALGVLGNSSDLFRRVTMLLQSPIRVEKCCPRWWSLVTAIGLLGLALFVSGIGLRADAAQDEQQILAAVKVDPAETPNADEKDEKAAEKKESKKKPALEKILRDLEELLNDLPSVLDADQVKQLQEQLKKAQAEVERTIEGLKKGVDSSKLKALQKDLSELQPSDFLQNEALNHIRELAETDVSKLGDAFGQEWGQRRHEGRLGVRVQKPSPVLAEQLDLPKDQGLVIERVLPDSAAAKGGLKAHDILLEFNGKPVPNDVARFVKILQDVKAGTPVDAVVLRKGKKETIKGLSLPEAKTRQQFQFRAVPGTGLFRYEIQPPNVQIPGLGGPDKRAVITTMVRSKDSFNTRYQEGSLIITVTGSVTDGKGKVKQIQIQDGRKSDTYESVDKVPEEYRDKVKNLIEMSEKNNLKIEVGADFRVIPLYTLEAKSAFKQLKNLFDVGGSVPAPMLDYDASSNKIMVRGTPEQVKAVKEALKQLGEADMSDSQASIKTVTITLERVSAVTLANALRRILPQLRRNHVQVVIPGSNRVNPAPETRNDSSSGPATEDGRGAQVVKKDLPVKEDDVITLTPLGNKLVAASADPQALKLVRELSRRLQNPAGEGDFEVIKLKNAQANEVAKTLDAVFNDTKTNTTSRIRVVVDPATNSLLVRANPLDLLTIRCLVEKCIDINNPGSKDVIKVWKIGPLKHAKAQDVAHTVKEVYREHVNNMLALMQSGALRNRYFGWRSSSMTPKLDANGNPRPVDLMADDATNSIIVACDETLFTKIKKLVDDLDEAAKDSTKVWMADPVKGIDDELRRLAR